MDVTDFERILDPVDDPESSVDHALAVGVPALDHHGRGDRVEAARRQIVPADAKGHLRALLSEFLRGGEVLVGVIWLRIGPRQEGLGHHEPDPGLVVALRDHPQPELQESTCLHLVGHGSHRTRPPGGLLAGPRAGHGQGQPSLFVVARHLRASIGRLTEGPPRRVAVVLVLRCLTHCFERASTLQISACDGEGLLGQGDGLGRRQLAPGICGGRHEVLERLPA